MDAKATENSQMPLYLTIEEAADYVGIGKNEMRAYLDSNDPPPFLRVGKRDRRIQREKLAAYMESKQEVVFRER